jgi:hypothetical protein
MVGAILGVLFGNNNQPLALLVGSNCVLKCLPGVPIGTTIPLVALFCCSGDGSFQCRNHQSNQFFTKYVYFYVLIDHVPQQLKYHVTNANFTVEERGNIIGKRNERPPRPLFHSELQFVIVTFCIIPQLTGSSIVHFSISSSRNWALDALHSMHYHPAIDSFPRAIAWKAKLLVRYIC